MFNAKQIEELVAKGKRPDSAGPFEWLLWFRLDDLVRRYKQGEIDAADAGVEKKDYVWEFESRAKWYENSTKYYGEIALACIAYAAEPTLDHADQMYKVVYGMLPRKDGGTGAFTD